MKLSLMALILLLGVCGSYAVVPDSFPAPKLTMSEAVQLASRSLEQTYFNGQEGDAGAVGRLGRFDSFQPLMARYLSRKGDSLLFRDSEHVWEIVFSNPPLGHVKFYVRVADADEPAQVRIMHH